LCLSRTQILKSNSILVIVIDANNLYLC
jgi:hypothetical protein